MDEGVVQRPGRLAAGCVVGLVLVYVTAVLTVPGQWLDDEVFGLAQDLPFAPLRPILPTLGRRVVPAVGLAVVAGVGVWALMARRWIQVGRAAAVVAVSVALARGLRVVLPRPDHGYSYDANTLPSTHVALVAACVVAVLIMWPTPRPSWLALVGIALVCVACVGNVFGYAHRPSDVVASVLLVAAVAGTALAVPRGRFIKALPSPPGRKGAGGYADPERRRRSAAHGGAMDKETQ